MKKPIILILLDIALLLAVIYFFYYFYENIESVKLLGGDACRVCTEKFNRICTPIIYGQKPTTDFLSPLNFTN